MGKFVSMGYITEVVILALTSFFSMPKVTEDIRMVFYATVSILNYSLWDPNLVFPSMGSLLILVGPEMHMVDLDVRGGVYNFKLSSALANYCGVDLGYYLGHKKYWQVTPLWMLWLLLMMGLLFPS